MKRVVIWLLAVCMLICMTPANVMAADKSEEDIVVTILSESVYNGHEQEPEMTVVLNGKKLKETTDYTVKYFDNINAGMATVTVDLDEKYSEYADAVIKQFPIKPCPISTCIIDIEDEDCVYNGKAVKPEVTVEESHGLEELTLGKDYTISYNNNVNPGKASVTITGKGNYCGTVNKPFTVKKIPVDDVVFEDVSDKTYSGKLIKPTPEVTLYGKRLVEGKDFTFSYTDNKYIGEAEVVLAGIGNYDGFSNTTFSIRADLSKRCSKATVGAISKKTYTGSKIKPSPIVKAVGANGKVVKLKKGTDYKLTYKNNKKIGKAKVIITGKGYYKGSLTKSFIIKPAAGSLTRAWGYPHEIVLKAKEKGGGVSYQFAYKKNGGSWKYKTRKTVNADLKDLSAGKYSVKVRCIKKVNGTIYKGKWSKAKTVKVTSSETKSQKKAYRTAKSYSKVRGYGGYSKFTLVDALKHDGFSEKDATYGVRKLDERGEVNWKKQALEEARRVKAEFNWSRKQVRDQLKVQEFTDAQIKYAMDRL